MDFALQAALAVGTSGIVLWAVTQVHLYRVARKLIKKSDASWAQAHAEIKAVKDDVLAEVRSIAEKTGGEDLKKDIAEIEGALHRSFDDLTLRVSNEFNQFQKTLIQTLTAPAGNLPTSIESKVAAQSDAVASRRANQIVNVLQREAIAPQIGEFQNILTELGHPELAQAIEDHPNTMNFVIRKVQQNPGLSARMNQMLNQGRMGPSNGSGQQK